MWRVNFIEREAWFVNLWTSVRRDLFADVCVTLNFSFISLKPQDFHETLYIRREIWSFPFYLYYAWIFLHFVRGDLLPPAHAILLAFILLRPFWFVWRTDQVDQELLLKFSWGLWWTVFFLDYQAINRISNFFLSAINNGDKSGKTPLHTAILSKQFKIVDRLLECGADVTRKDDAGDTAVHTAIRVGSERLVLVSINNNVQWYSYLSHEPPWNVLSNRQTLSIRVSNFSWNILEEILSLIRFCIRYSMHSVVSK